MKVLSWSLHTGGQGGRDWKPDKVRHTATQGSAMLYITTQRSGELTGFQ